VSDERGSGVVEFTWLCLLLLVPMVYLLLAVMDVQRASYAASAASRAAGRAYVLAPDEAAARARAEASAQVALSDQGIDWSAAVMQVSCTPDPAACLAPGSMVTVDVTVRQAIPMTGGWAGGPPSVRVSSMHSEPYGTYREAR
jgi:Flp pilus assembly protein TadG